jgi:glycine dehydrogenase subunit 1
MSSIPHTEEDEKLMLSSIGISSIDDLFAEVPKNLLQEPFLNLPDSMSEMAMLAHAESLANQNSNKICFIGAGSYDHHIPAAVWDIASRGEFLTSYTPYQAEVSQGSLQLLYEFQTMIAELTGMDVANASMYDGASALSEAVLMAVRINKVSQTKRVLVSAGVHPFYLQTLKTIVGNQNIEVIVIPIDMKTGITDLNYLERFDNEDVTSLVIASPNFFGCLEKVDTLADWATENNVISVACVNPVSLALYKPPSRWGKKGVDIVCGEGQPLGAPLASGGPYFGILSTKIEYVRQLPGRLVGQTTDVDGNLGYALTLQAREQHIRRAKATSNICTNQGLLVTAATIHMSMLGAEGLLKVAKNCHDNAHYLAEELTKIPGVELAFPAPFFHEFMINIQKPVDLTLDFMAKKGIFAGFDVSKISPEFPNAVLVCATEKRTKKEIDLYVKELKSFLMEA